MLTFCLVTGNLWQYPVKYAQGWDASLRCLPYFNLRNNAINYLNKSDIKIEEVATFFPNIYSNEEINLNNNNSCFAEYDSTNKYIFLANIYNLKPQQYQQLYQNYTVVKRFENWRIWVEVLKKR